MSWYYLTPTNKWGIIEIMNFRNEDKGILLKININWKRGSFYVHNLDEKEIPSSPNTIELESLFDEVSVASVENGAEEFLFYDAETKELIEDQDQFQEVIEGYISGRVKGGFTVEIRDIRAFLPGSLVDVRPLRDNETLEGQTLEFKV